MINIRSSSGTAGTFLKSKSVLGGKKIYYKLSNYDAEKGVVGHSGLYETGEKLPLMANDFRIFLERNVFDTTQACEFMHCSRQNLSYLVKQDLLPLAKSSAGGNLYFKGSLLKNMW